MQKVQRFHFKRAKVRGPMGVYEEERMQSAGADSINHGGKKYEAGDDGWIEVPFDVYNAISRMRHKHPAGGYTKGGTPNDVDEPLRLGLVDKAAEVAPPAAPRRTTRQRTTE